VRAAFYSFSPRMVAEHVPAGWAVAAPDRVLAGRLRAVDRLWRNLLGDRLGDPGLTEAAALAREAAVAAGTAGRPLAAANADLPWPDEPHLVLWQAITLLREHRGDGHVAALQAAGLDPCEALVSFAAIGAAPRETFGSRGWTEQEWAAAQDRLASRGWVDADGGATGRGRARPGRARRDRMADRPAGRRAVAGTRRRTGAAPGGSGHAAARRGAVHGPVPAAHHAGHPDRAAARRASLKIAATAAAGGPGSPGHGRRKRS
jgi:Helix-turn-helix family